MGNSDGAILTMAAYIDLNPVRALMVEDPADYTYSGYGEACAGRRIAQRRLAIALELEEGRSVAWTEVGAEYRKLLYGVGVERGVKRMDLRLRQASAGRKLWRKWRRGDGFRSGRHCGVGFATSTMGRLR